MKETKTPQKVRFYLENCLYYSYKKIKHPDFDKELVAESFKYVHEKGCAQCLEASIAAAVFLVDQYPPLIMHIHFKNETESHACYVYKNKKTNKWGCLGIWKENSRGAIFKNLDEVCKFIMSKRQDKELDFYTIHDFSGWNIIDTCLIPPIENTKIISP